MAEDLLDCLLSAAIEELPETSETKTSPKASFSDALDILDKAPETKPKKKKSLSRLSGSSKPAPRLSTIHRGDTDSSDDDDNRDFENRKYNESGRSIKHLIEPLAPAGGSYVRNDKATWKTKPEATKPAERSNPLFGMRVINPLVSSKVLEDRMVGREVVPLPRLKMFVRNVAPDKDWVIAGVIVHKSMTKTSQKGKSYSIWTLSDLKNDLKTVVVFLFGSAYKELWKTVAGTIVGILNPSVMELRDGAKDEACLSVDNHQRVMIIGQSKDLGTCKSLRKNGERCTAFVNTNTCEFCIYHVKQEYQKASQRSDIQSGFAGRGLTALRNKVLGKNQVFYAGRIFSAIPAKKNRKQTAKDEGRLLALAGFGMKKQAPVKTQKQKQAARLEIAADQKRKDLERLRQLGIHTELNLDTRVEKFNGTLSRDVTVEDSKSLALDVISKLKKSRDGGNAVKKTSKNDEQTAPQELEGNSQEVPNKSSEENVDLGADFKSLNELETSGRINGNKPEGTPEKNCLRLLNKLDDDVDLNIDFKNFQKNFLRPQTPNQGSEAFKPLPELNKPKNRTENKPEIPPKITAKSATLQSPKNRPLTNIPFLSNHGKAQVDLTVPIRRKKEVRAKQTAVSWVQTNGPIPKQDPNSTRGPEKGKKRALDSTNENENPKKAKIGENEFFSDRFKKMMAMTSNHADLLEERDNEEQEKYFRKLEMKEQMEEKMLTTYKVACKAVRCLTCKYTSFSASDRCKAEKHPLRVYDAMKRFFKCGNCGNRTVCLVVVPTTPCNSCGSSRWEKTSMMKERKVEIGAPKLSIRGGEQTFTNSVVGNANLDLMVPDES